MFLWQAGLTPSSAVHPPLDKPTGVSDLGELVRSVLLRMAMHSHGPLDVRRLTKQLKQVWCLLPAASCAWLLQLTASSPFLPPPRAAIQLHANTIAIPLYYPELNSLCWMFL